MAATLTGHFHVEVLPSGTSLNADGYIEFLKRAIRKFSRRKTHSIQWQNLVLMHDNARPHVAAKVFEFLRHKGALPLYQPPYSPDVNFCDRFLFRNFEHFRRDRHFESDDDLRNCVTNHFCSHSHDLLSHEYEQLHQHVDAVIKVQGSYV